MIKVRRYRKGEEEILRILCRETTLKVNIKEYGHELVRKWVTKLDDSRSWETHVKNKNPFVAEVEGEIVGFAEIAESGKIGGFYSHFQWQSRGVGSDLLKSIESEAVKLEIEKIWVESSLSAGKFFKGRGFCLLKKKQVFTDGVSSENEVLVKHLTNSKELQRTDESNR